MGEQRILLDKNGNELIMGQRYHHPRRGHITLLRTSFYRSLDQRGLGPYTMCNLWFSQEDGTDDYFILEGFRYPDPNGPRKFGFLLTLAEEE